jgi:hypothetical protein
VPEPHPLLLALALAIITTIRIVKSAAFALPVDPDARAGLSFGGQANGPSFDVGVDSCGRCKNRIGAKDSKDDELRLELHVARYDCRYMLRLRSRLRCRETEVTDQFL